MATTVSNSNLQQQLELWVMKCSIALELPQGSVERLEAIKEFCREFVPLDISQEDCDAYAGDLAADEEFFTTTCREISQCALNRGVESIAENQIDKAVFTLLPLSEQAVDIVREICFTSADGGVTWRAEG